MTTYLGSLINGDAEPGRYLFIGRVPLAAMRSELEAGGWTIRTLDGAAMDDRASMMEGFAGACDFPDWFGANWDALADSLGDMSWLPPVPTAIFWEHSGSFEERDPSDWQIVGHVIDTAIALRVSAGLPPLYVIYPTIPEDAAVMDQSVGAGSPCHDSSSGGSSSDDLSGGGSLDGDAIGGGSLESEPIGQKPGGGNLIGGDAVGSDRVSDGGGPVLRRVR